uniref:Uncharacterized protein n=1 Tax=Steinernema glaseri TaxID=37863 RepID=A0A1I7ZUC7_9BILA
MPRLTSSRNSSELDRDLLRSRPQILPRRPDRPAPRYGTASPGMSHRLRPKPSARGGEVCRNSAPVANRRNLQQTRHEDVCATRVSLSPPCCLSIGGRAVCLVSAG